MKSRQLNPDTHSIGALLSGALLSGALLSGALLSGALLSGAFLSENPLTHTLYSCIWRFPDCISICNNIFQVTLSIKAQIFHPPYNFLARLLCVSERGCFNFSAKYQNFNMTVLVSSFFVVASAILPHSLLVTLLFKTLKTVADFSVSVYTCFEYNN